MIPLRRRSFQFLGLTLGASRAEVLSRLRGVLGPPAKRSWEMMWRMKGRVLLRRPEGCVPEYYTTWDVQLGFEHGVLTEIFLECE